MTEVRDYTQEPSYATGIAGAVGRVGSVERAKPLPPNEHRVCVGASGSTLGYAQPRTPPWRPFSAATFTDLRADTIYATTGLIIEMFVNDLSVGSVTFGTSATFALASIAVTVDVFDRVDFRITSDPDGYSTWKGLCVQALGTSAHPMSAWLTFIDAGGVE